MVLLVPQSAVIKPLSTLGVVTRGKQVSVSRLGSEHFLTASVGSSFHIYKSEDLHLQYLSRPLGGEIGCVLSAGDWTAVSLDGRILIFHLMVQLAELKGHTDRVINLANLGDSFLISSSESEVLVWQLPPLSKRKDPLSNPIVPHLKLSVDFSVTCMISVPTYLNKILIGGPAGQLELWNVNKGQKIHTFASPKGTASITALSASPVLDVVGVGYADGTVMVMNLKTDEVVMTLHQKEHGGVTCMSFRNDSVGGQLVTGTSKGDLVIWDLNKRSVHSFHQRIHCPGGVGSVEFLDTLPLLVSAGDSDNAISIHIFDLPDGGCRLLKERRGFTGDLSFLMPYGENDLLVASASEHCEVGRLNLIQAHQNKVWSQKSLQSQTPGKGSLMPWKFRNFSHNQLPRVTSMSHCPDRLRHYDWPTIVTTHDQCAEAYVWSPYQECLVNRMLMVQSRKPSTGSKPPVAVQAAVSPCGNYAVLGLDNGELHRFNLQSCYHRGEVGKLESAPVALKFISSRDLLSADSQSIKHWKVVPRPSLVSTVTCVSDIASIEVYGFMCAVAHQNEAKRVSVIDLHTDRRVRSIELSDSVTAMTWASGGKWLAIASRDSRVIVFDLATACVIDRVEFSSPVIALRFTMSNSKLVTSHEGGEGSIRVWQNVALLHGPGYVGEGYVNIDSPIKDLTITPPPQKKVRLAEAGLGELVVAGGSKWQHILKLDEIKERNKPIRPAEKPKSAPFFLPVRYQGVQPVFAAPTDDTEDSSDLSNVKPKVDDGSANGFIEMVTSRKFNELSNHLIKATSSGVHICISELEDDETALNSFIEFLAVRTENGGSIDLVSTWTSLFLKNYGSLVRGRESFVQNLNRLTKAVKDLQGRFETETNQLQCLLKVAAALQLHR